jgi:hypothetical protein
MTFSGVVLTIVGFYGSWLILALALLWQWLDGWLVPIEAQNAFPLWLFGVAFGVCLISEVLEWWSGSWGAERSGASSRGKWGAFFGGFFGLFLGSLVPVPFLGSLLGVLVGTFLGALVGEALEMGQVDERGLTSALGALVGKVIGIGLKVPLALALWLSFAVRLFWH